MKYWFFSLSAALLTALLLISCSGSGSHDTLWQIAVAEDQRLILLDQIDKWIADPDSLVRARVAYAIGIVGQTDTYSRLSSLMDDKSDTVVLAALFAKGQVADTAHAEALIKLSKSRNAAIKYRALEALSKIGTISASARLSEFLNDNQEDTDLRAKTAQWMFRLKDSASAEALIAQAMNPNATIRERVYYSLSRRGLKDAQPLFRLGLQDQVDQIKIFAINGLSRINDTSSAAEVMPHLLSGDPRVQYHASNLMAKFGIREALPYVLQLTNANSDPHVRIAAIQALGSLKDKQSASALMDLLTDPNPNVASEALISYAKQERNDIATFAQMFSSNESIRKRVAAVQAFGTIKGDSSRIALERMTKDLVPQVRAEALDQLFNYGDAELANTYVQAALSDSDYMPVAIAAGKIAADRLYRFVPQMCELYLSTSLLENKQSILDVLIELSDSLTDRKCLESVRDSALVHNDLSVRRRGSELAVRLDRTYVAKFDHFTTDLTRERFDEVYGLKSNPRVKIETVRGTIVLELFPQIAPKTVANYLSLIKKGFYNNRLWHRVVPDFVIQDGCPRGDGFGSPGYEIRCEYNCLPFERGSLGMATSGKDTGGSQYFICHSAQPHLDGRYTVFGRVVEGLQIVDQIQLGDSINSVTVTNLGESQ